MSMIEARLGQINVTINQVWDSTEVSLSGQEDYQTGPVADK